MRAFGKFWDERRRGRAFPARSDFLAEEWGPWWTAMMLYRIEPDAIRGHAYRLVYEGDAVEYIDGGSQIGKRLDEIAPPKLVERAVAIYDRCALGRTPVYSIRVGTWHRTREVAFERLLLPLGETPQAVDHVLALLYDHGIDAASGKVEGVPPPAVIANDRLDICRIDPDSFASCDTATPGKGLGQPMPAFVRPA